MWWSWCYYNTGKMLYPARWKKIIVDQSKVLKNRLYRLFRVFFFFFFFFFGGGLPGIYHDFILTPLHYKLQNVCLIVFAMKLFIHISITVPKWMLISFSNRTCRIKSISQALVKKKKKKKKKLPSLSARHVHPKTVNVNWIIVILSTVLDIGSRQGCTGDHNFNRLFIVDCRLFSHCLWVCFSGVSVYVYTILISNISHNYKFEPLMV